MEARKSKYDIIATRLTYLQNRVSNDNSLNLTDLNIHAENFFRDLYELLGEKFDNTNYDHQNAAYVDLIDTVNKVAIQITSQNDNKKIQKSIDGFLKNPKYKGYKLKLLLISKEAKTYRTSFGENFDHSKDVIDMKRLLSEINNKSLEDLEKIATFLDKQVLLDRARTESTEVETIMTLIAFLSKAENRKLTDKIDNVDPVYKIKIRFSEHSEYLIEKYQELTSVYYSALLVANKNLDSAMSIIISSYLKDESDALLIKHNNDPRLALDALVNFFYEKLSTNGFKIFDKQAIRFYLLEEMIKCNVFPNK